MLHLQPTEISLTLGEIADLERQLHVRRGRAPLPHKLFTRHDSGTASLPRIRRGAERSRDESLTDSSLCASLPSIASSECDDLPEHEWGSQELFDIPGTPQESSLDNPNGSNLAFQSLLGLPEQAQKITRTGKDERGLNSEQTDFDHVSDGSDTISSMDATCMVHFDLNPEEPINEGASSSQDHGRENTGSQAHELFGLTPEPLFDSMSDYLRRITTANERARIDRPRSFSDPADDPIPSIVLDRRRLLLDTIDEPLMLSRYYTRTTAPSAPTQDNHFTTRDGSSALTPTLSQSQPRRFLSPPSSASFMEKNHSRHHSLPDSTASEVFLSRPSFTQAAEALRNHPGGRHSLEKSTTCMLEVIRDGVSPLEELAQGAAAWTADLPFRQSRFTRSTVRAVSPTEPGISRVRGYLQPCRTFAFPIEHQPLEMSVAIALGHHTSHATLGDDNTNEGEDGNDIDKVDSEATPQPRVPSQSLNIAAINLRGDYMTPSSIAIGRGGRPRIGAAHEQRAFGRQRRGASRLEQENDEDVSILETERQIWLDRNQVGGGGVLERTPPAEGRFERFL